MPMFSKTARFRRIDMRKYSIEIGKALPVGFTDPVA